MRQLLQIYPIMENEGERNSPQAAPEAARDPKCEPAPETAVEAIQAAETTDADHSAVPAPSTSSSSSSTKAIEAIKESTVQICQSAILINRASMIIRGIVMKEFAEAEARVALPEGPMGKIEPSKSEEPSSCPHCDGRGGSEELSG